MILTKKKSFSQGGSIQDKSLLFIESKEQLIVWHLKLCFSCFTPGSFFDKFPFLLPCLFNCTLMLIAIVLNYLFLEETLVKR